MFNPFTPPANRQQFGRRFLSLIYFSLLALTLPAQTVLWTNPITGTNPNSSNPYTTGQTVNAFITVTGIGRGAGITGSNADNRYNATSFSTSTSLTISNNDYFTFTLAPNAGYRINLSSFVYTGQRSSTGPRDFAFRHSSSSFGSNIGTVDDNGATVSLTAATYQGLSASSEFRFYGWDADAGTGTHSINDFTFNGSVLGTSVTTLSGFTSCPGFAGTAQSFTINGNGLSPSTALMTVAATTNYEVSVTSAVAGFSGTSVSFNAAGGNVSQTIWVRLKASAAIGPHNGEVVTVSGGGFAVGAGVAVTLNGSVPANDATVSLTTAPATLNQTVCINNSIATVDYTMGGTATGINFSGSLPAGVSGGFSGGVYTISGTPTAQGTYNYTLTTTGGTCNSSISGSVVVIGDATVNLFSGNDNQSVCQGTPITSIIYSVGGSGTGGSVTGLPAGVTGVYNAGQITISGTPSAFGVFGYTVNTTGPCITPTASGTITVNEASTLVLSAGNANPTICINNAITQIDFTRGGSSTGWTLGGSLPAGVSGTDNGAVYTISGTPTVAGPFSYSLTADGPCPVAVNETIQVDDNSTLVLTSAGATTSQTVCINTAITNITYAVGGGGTGATVIGLPAGVNFNFAAGVLTISGSPSVAGSFSYTVTTTGPCSNPSLGGTIDVTGDATIALTSGAGTNNQTFCINTALPVNITYAVGGTGTGISIQSGTLPTGMSGNFSAGVYTITGTPTESGIFILLLTSEGPCATPTANVTLNVQANSTIVLNSAAGTDAQTVCINTAITPVSYAIGGGGTGATVSGLPTGLSGSFNSGVYTISGSPTQSGSFNYTVTTTGPCVNVQSNGTIDVTPNGTISLTSAPATAHQIVCDGSPIVDIIYAIGGSATSASITSGSLPAGLSGSYNAGVFTITGTPTAAGTFNFTVTATGPCVEPSLSGSILVNVLPTLNAAPPAVTICVGDNTGLTATSNVNYPPVLVNELFNVAGSGTFTATGSNSGGGTAFQNFTSPSLAGLTTITNNNGTRFMMASVAAFGSANTNSQLTSPVINTAGYSALSLTFRHTYDRGSEAGVSVQVSTDPGNTVWSNINTAGNVIATNTYTSNQGANNNFVTATFNLSNYVNQPNFRIRFNYVANVTLSTAWWAIDDVNLSGTPLLPLYSWSADTGPSENGLPPNAGTFLAANNNISVDPTLTTTYTLSVKHPVTGCENTGSQSTVTVNQNGTIDQSSAVGTEAQTVCINTAIADITYNIGGAATGAQITAGALPAGVTGTYSAGVFTISGTPTEAGTFPYTVSTTGSLCVNPSLSGSITVTPNATITLSSSAGTDAQTVCINTAITNITYAVGGSGDNASITAGALPNGVSGSYNAGVYTISGTPTESGSFAYTVTATGPCGSAQVGGTLDVDEDGTISLSSAPGTDAQTVCINTAITDITYNIGGTATGATISSGALPNGVTGSYNGGVYTISGTPTESGSFSYTVSATGSPCVNPSLSGSITVTPDATISLSSAVGTDAQTVCINTAITNITYAVGGSGNNASITSGTLPDGVTGSYNAGVYTISGTPTESGSFAYTVSATGPCGSAQVSGTLDVDEDGTISLSSAAGTDAQTVCINTTIADIVYNIGGSATGATISSGALPNGVTGSYNGGVYTISGTPTESGSFSYTVSATGSSCVNPSMGGIIEVTAEAVVGTISGPTGVCAHVAPTGVAAVYTVSSSDPLSVFTWTLPAGALSVTGQGTGTISFIYPSGYTGGSIAVDVTSSCGPLQNRTLNVSTSLPVTPPLITGITNVCPYIGLPDQLTYSVDPVPGALNYDWIIPPSCSFVSGQGTNSIVITVGANFQSFANKVIRVRVESGCGNSDYTLKYLQAQFPMTPGPITGLTDVCEVINTPTEVTYSINKVLAATSYVWSTPAGTTVTHPEGPGINDTIIKVVFDNAFVTSNITVISVNNCTTSGSSRSITVYRKNPPVPGLISGPTNACEFMLPAGQQAYYTIRKIPVATSYTWTVPAGAVVAHENAPGVNDTAIFVTFPAAFASGQIKVKSHNGCGNSLDRSLSISKLNVGMPSPIDVVVAAVCPNRLFVYSIAGTPYNATSLVWTVPAGASINFGQGTTSIQVSYPGTAILGDVTVQAFNNCSQSLIRTVSLKLPACPPVPKVPVQLLKDDSYRELDVTLFSNPSTSDFKVLLRSSENTKANIRVMNVQGKILIQQVIVPGEIQKIGGRLIPGSYFIEVQQGEKRKTLRVVKL